jgi:hypothetical protein
LFQDPHFNVMDGLDTYIDDYTKADPIPEAMLRGLNQARGLLFDREIDREARTEEGAVGGPAARVDAAATPDQASETPLPSAGSGDTEDEAATPRDPSKPART